MEAVKERCSSGQLSLDLYYEKMKMEMLKSLDNHHHALSDVIKKAKKEDLEHLENLHDQLQIDLKKLEELMQKSKKRVHFSKQPQIKSFLLQLLNHLSEHFPK